MNCEPNLAVAGDGASVAAKRVLLVSGNFAPVSDNSSFRALGYVEELPRLGWEPVVLTRNPASTPWRIDSGLIPQCPTISVSGSVFLWKVWKRLRRKIEWAVPESIVADHGHSWIPFATLRGVRAVRRYDVSVVFGMFQPWSSLVVAFLISRLTKRPLIAEFRDPILSVVGTSKGAERRLDLARRIVLHAEHIVATTEEIAQDIAELVGHRLESPPVVLPHGFRNADRLDPEIPAMTGDFVLTFTGSLYPDQCLETLCGAVADLAASRPAAKGKIRLKIVGRQKENSFALITEAAARNGIEDALEFIPWQSQESLREIVAGSHLLWCTDATKRVIIPGKLAKLFAYGRPVLAICSPDGPTWRAVAETETGASFDYEDRDGVFRFVSGIFDAAVSGGARHPRNDSAVNNYSFSSLTARLAELLDTEAASRNGGGSRK